jgi:hypothetical protein
MRGFNSEIHPQLLRKPLHVPELMPVEGNRHRLETQWEATLQQEANPPQAPLMGTTYARHPLVGLLGAAVQRDLERKRTPLRQMVRDFRGDECAVGEQGDDEPLRFGVSVYIQEILPGKDLTTGVEKP